VGEARNAGLAMTGPVRVDVVDDCTECPFADFHWGVCAHPETESGEQPSVSSNAVPDHCLLRRAAVIVRCVHLKRNEGKE